MAPALEAENIVMRFGGVVAVDDISLQVPHATIVGLIGPNGAGKSTLFAICSGLRRPTAGRVLMDGEDVTGATPQARARRGLSRTFQRPEIFFTMTVREHLEFAYRARMKPRRVFTDLIMAPSRWRVDRQEVERVDELLDALGLSAVEHRRAAALPLGSQRRLEVGRALAGRPKLLLLDEPSSGLDVHETEQLGEVLRNAAERESIALLLVEHDLDLVLGLSRHIYVIDFGKLIFEGTPAQTRSSSTVQAAYLGQELDAAPLPEVGA
jgi:ABC-type branched-subunit amino acid transport system ATPase component